jgi:thiamine monophosphate kinase
MNGGEDYELLFTVPIADHEKISEMEGVRLIGHQEGGDGRYSPWVSVTENHQDVL